MISSIQSFSKYNLIKYYRNEMRIKKHNANERTLVAYIIHNHILINLNHKLHQK